MNFQKRLKELRMRQGLTQTELSIKLRNAISDSTIGMYEQGNRKPSLENLEILADYFNVDIDYLLGNTNFTTRLVDLSNNDSTINRIILEINKLNNEEQEELLEDIIKIVNYKQIIRGK